MRAPPGKNCLATITDITGDGITISHDSGVLAEGIVILVYIDSMRTWKQETDVVRTNRTCGTHIPELKWR